jgi:hypothetical protein
LYSLPKLGVFQKVVVYLVRYGRIVASIRRAVLGMDVEAARLVFDERKEKDNPTRSKVIQ